MSKPKFTIFIPVAVLLVIAGTFCLFLLNESTNGKELVATGQINKQATTSEFTSTQVEELSQTTSFPVNTWTQKDDGGGHFADYTEITIPDLRPYTDKKLELKLSTWSSEEGNPSSSNGEIRFDREKGELLFDPTETASDISEGIKRSDDVILRIYRTEPGLSKDEVIKQIVTNYIKSAFYNNDSDPQEIERSIEEMHTYCTATQFEGDDYYVFLENAEYKLLQVDEQDSFGPCPIGMMYYFIDDLVITKVSKQRQFGVSVDEMIIK